MGGRVSVNCYPRVLKPCGMGKALCYCQVCGKSIRSAMEQTQMQSSFVEELTYISSYCMVLGQKERNFSFVFTLIN